MATAKSGTVTASATHTRKGQKPRTTSKDEQVPVEVVPTGPLGEVEVAIGRTVNLGNYNSLRVDVHVRIPVARGEEEKGIHYAQKLAETHAERIEEDLKAFQ